MAYSINKVTLVGNVGNDPEVKTFQNGNKVVNLSLATSERWKDKETGEMKSNTEWHRVVIFNVLKPVWIWQAFFLKKRFIKQLTIVSIRFITKNCDNCFTRTKFFS